METRLYKIMRHALCAAVASAAISANATTYYWYGSETDNPLDPGNYHVSASAASAVLTELPLPGDTIQIVPNGGYCIRFDDDSVAYLASLETIQMRMDTRCIIDVSTNSTVNAALHYGGSGYGTVVKRGAGRLTLTATGDNDYDTSFIVEEGDLVFPQSGLTGDKYHAGLVVSNGCNVVLDGGLATAAFTLAMRGGISGDGDVAYTNTSTVCTLYVGGTTKELFSGVLSGDNLQLWVYGSLMLANNANTFAYGGNNGILRSNAGGTLGFRKFGTKSAVETSSFGKLDNVIGLYGGDRTFLNLATEADGAQTGNRVIRDYSGATTTTFDGGAYGNFTFNGQFQAYGAQMRELVLSGDHENACTYQGSIAKNATSMCYLTKRGTGTWVLSSKTDDSSREAIAGIGVENGTLRFMNLAEQGDACSLGKAPADYLFGYALKDTIANVASSNKVDYAIRLGNVRDLSEEGTLEYAAVADGFCTTRKIAVTGRGRLKNSAIKSGNHKALSWTGVKSVVPPEDASLVPALSTLTLDCASTGKSTLTNITEDAGAAPLRIAKEGAGDWTLGGTLAFTGGIDVREGTLNVGTMTTSLPYLRVDSGATLNMADDAATANALSIDMNEGVGTISGIAFASAGTLSITNAPAEMPFTIPCDLSRCTGLSNISGWTVELDGVASQKIGVKVKSTGLTVDSRRGFVILVR